MAGEKRNKITKERRRVLEQPGVIYTVRCPGTHCDCTHFGAECRRGFFSLWIQAVYGICFAENLGIPYYIKFDDKPYLYSDPEKYKGDLNFWNYYYLQRENSGEGRNIPNRYIENYPLRIWNRSHLRKVYRSAVKDLKAKDNVQSYINQLVETVKKQKTLGIHIRNTDHPSEVGIIPLERYLKVIGKQAEKYRKFFISTDDSNVLDVMAKEFGHDRLIYQPATRSDNKNPVHTNMQNKDRYRLGLEVLADCYTLSVCQGAILSHSNVSYGALLLNPNLPYYLLETSASRKSRQKTNLLYTLDRLGIRKM